MSVQIKKHYASVSDAIRAGAAMGPQTTGHMMRGGATCALGSAALALGISVPLIERGSYFEVASAYPYLETGRLMCPVGCEYDDFGKKHKPQKLGPMIVHLNDLHRWTRERIADFVQGHEDSIGYVTLIEEAKESAQELVTV